MLTFDDKGEPSGWGTWEDAEALRRWSFRRRTPDQRLAWLISALELAYAAGALSPRMPDAESLQAPCSPSNGIRRDRVLRRCRAHLAPAAVADQQTCNGQHPMYHER